MSEIPVNAKPNRAEGDVDRIVRDRFFPDRGSKGVFVDVGAARPDFLSVSALYREMGWRVIAIEPNPEFCELQRRAGSEALQYACSDRDADDVEFTLVNLHGHDYEGGKVSYESLSSLGIKPEFARTVPSRDERRTKVKVRRLDTILRDHAPDVETIDILSMDVEGWEMEVLDGLDLARYRPRVMVIENFFRSTKYVDRLNRDGYVLWKRLYPNDVFVATERSAAVVKLLSSGVRLTSAVQTFCRRGARALGRLLTGRPLRTRPGTVGSGTGA